MRRWLIPAVMVFLLLALARPALAQDGAGGRVVFGEDYTLRTGQQLNGDLVVFGGSAVVEEGATVRGSVVAFGGTVRVAGLVDGDVTAIGGRVDLQGTATVTGQVTSTGGTIGDSRARVDGGIIGGSERVAPPEVAPGSGVTGYSTGWTAAWSRFWTDVGRLLAWLFQTVLALLTMVAIAAVVTALSPRLVNTAGDALTSYPAESIAGGLLAGLASAVALVILTITCIGLPAAVVLVLALALALLLGWIVVGMVVGERVLAGLNQPQARPVLSAVVGVFLLTLLARLPGLGVLVAVLVGAWGLGAVVLTRFGTTAFSGSLSRSSATTPPEPPQPAS